MSHALDLIPDFGDRTWPDGQPVDELGLIMMVMPPPENPDLLMLASAIMEQRLRGNRLDGIQKALADWDPGGLPN